MLNIDCNNSSTCRETPMPGILILAIDTSEMAQTEL